MHGRLFFDLLGKAFGVKRMYELRLPDEVFYLVCLKSADKVKAYPVALLGREQRLVGDELLHAVFPNVRNAAFAHQVQKFFIACVFHRSDERRRTCESRIARFLPVSIISSSSSR